MKKLIMLVCCLLLVGCNTLSNTPKKQVEILLNNYQSLNDQVLNDIDYTIFFNTDLTQSQKDKYTNVMKRQYKDMIYTIKDEVIDGDIANVEVEIEVYDYKSALDSAKANTLENLPVAKTKTEEDKTLTSEDKKSTTDKVNDTNIDVKLKKLEEIKTRVKYSLNITLTKEKDTWVVDDLTTEQLQKINGVY